MNINALGLAEKKALYVKARKQYYNAGNSELTDGEYDTLEDALRLKVPKWVGFQKTGHPVTKLGKKTEVTLNVPCPSLNKLVADKPVAVVAWIAKLVRKYGQRAYISAKIDGSSVEATWTNGKLAQLATRGDGTVGKSILFLAPYLNLPAEVPATGTFTVRFEAAMPLKTYTKKWSGQYDSARALASAVLNRQDASAVLKDLDFIALRVLHPAVALSQGLATLKSLGFNVVEGKTFDLVKLDQGLLPEILATLRGRSKYECDGMVICSDAPRLVTTADRPEYAVAYKANDEAGALETTVVDIVWKASAFGLLVPKAIISPIKFGGVTVKQAALHNAKWAIERGVGIGAKVRVLRSGDIIPKIIEVVSPEVLPLPNPKVVGKYKWDATKTALVLQDSENNVGVLQKKFSRFFAALDLEQLAGGLAEKLIQAGYRSTEELVGLTAEDFAKLPGVKSSAKTYATQIARVRNGEFPLNKLMVASGVFDRGVGRTRLAALQDAGDYLSQKAALRPTLYEEVWALPGCGQAFAKLYTEGLPKFWEWMARSGAAWKAPVKTAKPVVMSGPLSGQAFSWTGYRSKDEEALIAKLGGQVVPFGSKTTVLFYSESGKTSTKVEKAQAKGIQTSTFPAYMAKKATLKK